LLQITEYAWPVLVINPRPTFLLHGCQYWLLSNGILVRRYRETTRG
jgi:hypothetical protein